jgi:hypothetical protein
MMTPHELHRLQIRPEAMQLEACSSEKGILAYQILAAAIQKPGGTPCDFTRYPSLGPGIIRHDLAWVLMMKLI